MKSNNHYIWDEYKKSHSHTLALSFQDQIRDYARTLNLDPRGVRLLDKKTLTETNRRHADCEIVWSEGPDDWAYDIDLTTEYPVSIEAHSGSSLTFYSL